MTENITPIEILRTRQNFSDYVENTADSIILKVTKGYPTRQLSILRAQLTQSNDGLLSAVNAVGDAENAYIFWFIVNENADLLKTATTLNNLFSKNYGIFVIKMFENKNKIDYECIVKPNNAHKKTNTEAPAKLLQKQYWEQYFEVCDSLSSDMQINPAPQHLQYIPIGKSGVQILQTINTKDKYIATELLINSKKEIYNKLTEYKDEIEKKLGELEWHCLETNKSSRIRKYINIDITNPQNTEKAIKAHIKTAEDFSKIFKKYL